MKNITRRTLTGLIFIILICSAIIIGRISFVILFAAITVLGLWEFYGLAEKKNGSPNKVPGLIVGLAVFVTNALVASGIIHVKGLLIILPLVFMIFILELYRRKPNPFTNLAYTITGLVYVAVPMSLLNYLPDPNFTFKAYNYTILLGFFALIWIYDTGAYIFGTAIGKKRLLEKISPKKTWEGAIGGAILCLISAVVIAYITSYPGLTVWLGIALIVIVFGTYGDLCESLLKRCINTKDSGKILPGHGGVLDRFDGVIMTTPFALVYLVLVIK